jgi:polyhydroxyalkanoate synthase
MEGATRQEGSWWPTWQAWLSADGSADKVPARVPGEGRLPVLEAAPGSYVKQRA